MSSDGDKENTVPRLVPSEDSSDEDSLPPARVSWVYTLKKEEVIKELTKFQLETKGTLSVLRKRLVNFLRERYTEENPREKPPVTVPVQAKPEASTIPSSSQVKEAGEPSAMQETAAWPKFSPPVPSPVEPRVATLDEPPARPPLNTSTEYPAASFSQKPAMNISEVVRKWKLTFNGKTDPVEFLEKLCDFQEHSGIQARLLLPTLFQVFQGNALEWYRNCRSLWSEWDDFLTDFKQFYLPADYQSHLEDEIYKRKQQPGELGRDYVVVLQTLIRRHGGFSPEKTVRRLYENLLPKYRQYIRRTEVQTPRDLVVKIDEFEALDRELNGSEPRSAMVRNSPREPTPRPDATPRPRFSTKPSYHDRPPPVSVTASAIRHDTAPPEIQPRAETATRQYARHNICWRCGEEGHFRSQCRGTRRIFCSRCGRDGVLSRDCHCHRPATRTTQCRRPASEN